MKRIIFIITAILFVNQLFSQEVIEERELNTSARMLQDESRLTIGGYAQIDYNQPLSSGTYNNGVLDVHRLVLLFGYKFNDRTKFITEIEYEHVSEVYVEQAFLQYEIAPWLNFRGGLMLIPMGIINEYHEPPTFNGVERPNVDKFIVPTTWREIGAGFSGTFPLAGLSYQLYLVNGFSGYTDGPAISGKDGFRKGRQKGAESLLTSPNLSFRVEHFGLPGLQVGISGYSGKTQTSLKNGLDRTDKDGMAIVDSSVCSLNMVGADLRYSFAGLKIRGQVNYGLVGNSRQYNEFTGSDVGNSIFGWYGEIAYDLFSLLDGADSELISFIRYENYDTHAGAEGDPDHNPAFNRSDITFGAGWKITEGVMLKGDYQLFMNKGDIENMSQVNLGIGIWF